MLGRCCRVRRAVNQYSSSSSTAGLRYSRGATYLLATLSGFQPFSICSSLIAKIETHIWTATALHVSVIIEVSCIPPHCPHPLCCNCITSLYYTHAHILVSSSPQPRTRTSSSIPTHPPTAVAAFDQSFISSMYVRRITTSHVRSRLAFLVMFQPLVCHVPPRFACP